jgi:hypothetical protein
MYEAVRNKDCNASWWRISVRVEHLMVGRHHLPTIKRSYETRNNRRNDPDEAIEPFPYPLGKGKNCIPLGHGYTASSTGVWQALVE